AHLHVCRFVIDVRPRYLRTCPTRRSADLLGQEAGMDLPVVARAVRADLLLALDHDGQRGRLHAADGGEEEAAIARVEGRHGARADRKSTRLNSSHVKISYAVFCLKKKNKR